MLVLGDIMDTRTKKLMVNTIYLLSVVFQLDGKYVKFEVN